MSAPPLTEPFTLPPRYAREQAAREYLRMEESHRRAQQKGPALRQRPGEERARRQALPPKRPGISIHLETLGLPERGQPLTRDYLRQTVHPAWRQLARRHHPDRNPGDRLAEERAKALNAAYEALKAEVFRADPTGI